MHLTLPTRQPLATRRRLGLVLAIAGAASVLGTASAGADPAGAGPPAPTRETPLGLPQTATDVLGPTDPAFFNPAVPGTRVLSPIAPRDEVICLAGFVPVINCWTNSRDDLGSTPRPLAHVDVPMIGAAPLRIWVDLPRWGDGSTGEGSTRELTNDVVVWWLTNITTL